MIYSDTSIVTSLTAFPTDGAQREPIRRGASSAHFSDALPPLQMIGEGAQQQYNVVTTVDRKPMFSG